LKYIDMSVFFRILVIKQDNWQYYICVMLSSLIYVPLKRYSLFDDANRTKTNFKIYNHLKSALQ